MQPSTIRDTSRPELPKRGYSIKVPSSTCQSGYRPVCHRPEPGLTDLPRYAEWNPFFTSAEGPVEVGRLLAVRATSADGSAQEFRSQVVEVREHELLSWVGHVIKPPFFLARHEFHLSAVSASSTDFRQVETFTGLLVPFARRDINRAATDFPRMDEALKRRARPSPRRGRR
jgi:hypothetical protein